MAAEIFRLMLSQTRSASVGVDSFGTNPYYQDNPEVRGLREKAVAEVMGGIGDMMNHRPKGIDDIDLKGDELLVLLAPKDLPALSRQVDATRKSPRMIVWDIEDPFTKPLSKYIESAATMKAHIKRNFNQLSST